MWKVRGSRFWLPLLALTLITTTPTFAGKPGGKTTTLSLSVTVSPSTITEGTAATGTVSHNNSSLASPVTVALTSSDTTEATVPGTVTIPAGTDSVTFTVTAVNDSTSDGNQTATISASSSGYASASAVVTVKDKPVFEYRIEAIPTGTNNEVWINGITNNSRVYGKMFEKVDGVVLYLSGFVYDQVSQTMYDMNQIPLLTSQVHMLAGPDFGFSSIIGMNEAGLMLGSIRDTAGAVLGIAIDTTVDGQFSPDPADWVVQLLPDFGSTFTTGRRINESGDILGLFQRADGTAAAFLYNPWLGGTPVELPVNLYGWENHVLNDNSQVAGIDEFRRAFLYDAATDSIQFFEDATFYSITGLNNSGVFAGTAGVTVPATRGKGTTTTLTAFRHDGAFQPLAGSGGTTTAGCLNEAGDLAYYTSPSGGPTLSHTGFAPDYTERQLTLSTLIAADDPLKDTFLNHSPDVFSINDRDVTGYPQLAVRLYFPTSGGGVNDTTAVILTPYLIP